MKPIRFLPFLALCLGLGATQSASLVEIPDKKKRRKALSGRDRVSKTFFGRRLSWGNPHLSAKQAARLERRVFNDTTARAKNYAGWCGHPDSGSLRVD